MKVSIKKLPKSEVKVAITLEPAEFEKYVERAIVDFSNELKVPGFRPGHIPREIVEQKAGKDAIEKHAAELAIPPFTTQAIQQEKLVVVARPQINVTKQNPLAFEVHAALLPEVKIKDYKKVGIPKKPTAVAEKEVDEELKRIQKAYAEFKPMDRGAKKGDRVEIDFEGSENGVVLDQLKSKNHPLLLGEEMLVPGFEDALVSMKKGEKKEFDLVFPKNHPQKNWQGKKVHFKVAMQGVSEVVLPEWTPEFLKKVTGVEKTLDVLRAEITDAMLREKVLHEEERRENELIEALLKLATIELSDLLIKEEVGFIQQETEKSLKRQNLTWERYEAAMKNRGRDVQKEMREEAARRLSARRLIDYLVEKENITVKPEDVEKEVKRILQGKTPEELKINPAQLQARITHTMKVRTLFSQFLSN